MNKLILALMTVVIAVCLLPTSAYAACNKSDRVSRSNAECLSGWWANKTTKTTFDAQNMRPDFGKVVARIDIRLACPAARPAPRSWRA